MIVFNRLNGKTIAINPDLIERVEATPDTIVTLVDDKKFLVAESLDEVLALITDYRAYVIARSTSLSIIEEPRPTLHVVPNEMIVSPLVIDGELPDDEPSDDELGAVVDYLPVAEPETEIG